MRIYLVTVQAGPSGRIIDSHWVEKKSAERRVADLHIEFCRSGKQSAKENSYQAWYAWMTEAELQDAKLEPKG